MIRDKNASREEISKATAEGGSVDEIVSEDEDGVSTHHISWLNRRGGGEDVCECVYVCELRHRKGKRRRAKRW
jgi:hypothetical protein